MVNNREIPWRVIEMATRVMDDNEEGIWGLNTLLYRLLLFRFENDRKMSGSDYFEDVDIGVKEVALIELLNNYWGV